MTEYPVSFDAAVAFSDGADLAAHGFRADVPSHDIDETGIAGCSKLAGIVLSSGDR